MSWKFTLTIENTTASVTSDHIQELCQKYGTVRNIVSQKGPTVFVVEMAQRQDAVRAWAHLAGALLDGQAMEVTLHKVHAKGKGGGEGGRPRSPPMRRRNSPPPKRRSPSRRRRSPSSSSRSPSRNRRRRSPTPRLRRKHSR